MKDLDDEEVGIDDPDHDMSAVGMQYLLHPHLVPLRLSVPQKYDPLPLGGGVHAYLAGVNLRNTTQSTGKQILWIRHLYRGGIMTF